LTCGYNPNFALEGAEIFLELILMIRSSIHKFATQTGTLGSGQLLRSTIWEIALCPSVDTGDYQQKPNGEDRFELKN